MNIEQLKQINQIQAITDQTVEALTEPVQPIYLMIKPEQYNLLAQHISQTGNAIVRNTDLISELPTQEALDEMMRKPNRNMSVSGNRVRRKRNKMSRAKMKAMN